MSCWAIKQSPDGMTRRLQDEAETVAAGIELANEFDAGTVVVLSGTLGAGKTCFTRGIAQGLGFEGDTGSPTFSLVHEYRGGRLPIFHFDFYRLESVDELLDIGWEEYLTEGGVTVAEWADKFPEVIPPGALWISLAHGEEEPATRTLTIEP